MVFGVMQICIRGDKSLTDFLGWGRAKVGRSSQGCQKCPRLPRCELGNLGVVMAFLAGSGGAIGD